MPLMPMNTPGSLDHRELAARSEDIVSVYNPLDKDYFIYYDSRPWKVAAQTETNLPRYIAVNYIDQMINLIIMKDADEAVAAENADRIKKRKLDAMTGPEVEKFSRSMMPDRLSSQARTDLVKSLFIRTVSRYGEGMPPLEDQLTPKYENVDTLTLMQDLENDSPSSYRSPSDDYQSPSQSAIEDMI